MSSFWICVFVLGAYFGGMVVNYSICQRWLRPKWEAEASGEAVRSYKYERDQRELHDSGRLRPPRPDAGPPAVMHRARPRAKRSTR